MLAKDFGERSALASSQPALAKAFEDLSGKAGAPVAANAPDLSLRLDPQIALKQFFLKDFAEIQLNGVDSQLSPAKLESVKASAVRWSSFEEALRQVAKLKLDFSIDENKKATLAFRADARKDARLEKFLLKQNASAGAPRPAPISIDGAALFGAARLNLDNDAIDAAAAYQGRVAKAIGREALAKDHEELAAALLEESTGAIGFCVGVRGNSYFICLRTTLKNEKAGYRLKDAIEKLAGKTKPGELACLREWKSGTASYCLLEGRAFWLLSGKFDSIEAEAALASRKVLPIPEWDRGLIGYAAFSPDASPASAFALRVDASALVADLRFTPSDLDKIPLPTQADAPASDAAPLDPFR